MTINKLKLGLVILALVLAPRISPALAAGEIVWNSDANVTFTGTDNIQLTILSGSKATSYSISPTAITVTVNSPDTFTLYSGNRYNVANNASLIQECPGSYSKTVVREGTVTLTPSTARCTTSSTGAGVYDLTPPTNTSILINAGEAETTSRSVTLTLGATDAAAMQISNYPDFSGGVWEVFSPTKLWNLIPGDGLKTVYARFRDLNINVSSAVSDIITLIGQTAAPTPPSPTPTPIVLPSSPPSAPLPTIAELQAQIKALIEAIKLLQAGESGQIPKGILTKGLTIGSKGNEVTVLQNFLRAQGKDIYPGALVTGYFGPATRRAVQRFQIKFGLAKSGDRGYGYVGPKTRAMINELNK